MIDTTENQRMFIFDQYNRKSENVPFWSIQQKIREKQFGIIFQNFLLNCQGNHLYNNQHTDPNAEMMKLPDYSSITVFKLNEIDNVMDDSEMLKLIQSFFRNQTHYFVEQLLFQRQFDFDLSVLQLL